MVHVGYCTYEYEPLACVCEVAERIRKELMEKHGGCYDTARLHHPQHHLQEIRT